jgi:hypothetical protein
MSCCLVTVPVADDLVKGAVAVNVDSHGLEAVIWNVGEHAPKGVGIGMGGAVGANHVRRRCVQNF